ncbi:MAG: DUF4835 family protein [Bacteroidota bacterium]|nr:DUF4835 family protein [Bacteroidota bacterium]
MLKYVFTLALSFLIAYSSVSAQELNCEVIINDDQVSVTDKRVFRDMQRDISNFLNNQRWTSTLYKPEERIQARMLITITSVPTIGNYTATVQVLSARPVYGTGFETTMLSFFDKDWVFEYTDAQPLQFSENSYTSHLASLLTFYAYLIIGLDNDSFSSLGGSAMYDRATNVLNNVVAQNLNAPGWKAFEDTRNRYWLLTNLQDPQIEPFRTAVYNYFRQGMDIFIQKPADARTNILKAIKSIQQVAQRRPGTAIIRSFFDAKSDEIVNVFKGGAAGDKQAVYAILSELDPTNITKYQVLLQR